MPVATISQAPVDMQQLVPVGEKLRDLRDELMLIFPEREDLITQLVYALLTRENVLVFGAFGTGKTDLLNTLFSAITDSRKFSISLTKFMTEGHVVGLPDPNIMKTQGFFHYRPEGGILEAQFVELDEIFDANAPLLRTLLGILNERNFKRGRQFEQASLHTAIASTNGSPEEEIKRAPELGAVIDRFIFHSTVEYLRREESRRRMYRKYLSGEKPTSTISYDDLMAISEVVVGANQITDINYIAVYDQVIQAYRQAVNTRVISDRRACKLLKLVEANAVLYGRYDVGLEDLMAIKWGICLGGKKEDFEAFDRAVIPVLESAKTSMPQNIDATQMTLLELLLKDMPQIGSNPTSNELVDLKRALNRHRREIDKVVPQLPSTEAKKAEILAELAKRMNKVVEIIDQG